MLPFATLVTVRFNMNKTVDFLMQLASTTRYQSEFNMLIHTAEQAVQQALIDNNALLIKQQFSDYTNATFANERTVAQI